ncbi:MAG: hypothetical protein PHQ61_08430 [Candidatus Omnitrophica bacterium]|nr:hypothetical protein [Candidatus Omnitrophota bacterium]
MLDKYGKTIKLNEKRHIKSLEGRISEIVEGGKKAGLLSDGWNSVKGKEIFLYNLIEASRGNKRVQESVDEVKVNGVKVGKIQAAWYPKHNGKPRTYNAGGSFSVIYSPSRRNYTIELKMPYFQWWDSHEGNIDETPLPDDWDIKVNEDNMENVIKQDAHITETEKETIIKARIGQGKFREDVISLHKKCPITGLDNPVFLRAGHLKPWAECDSNEERLDPLNGLALTPVADLLVDKGFIVFDDRGIIEFSEKLNSDDLEAMGIDCSQAYQIEIRESKQLEYIQYHRKKFRKI